MRRDRSQELRERERERERESVCVNTINLFIKFLMTNIEYNIIHSCVTKGDSVFNYFLTCNYFFQHF